MDGRELLVKGIIWRVGTGFLIDIRNDPWLPSIVGFKL